MSVTLQPVLVTGAAGYIGRHLVVELLARGHEVLAVIRPGSSNRFLKEISIIGANLLALKIIEADLIEDPQGAISQIASAKTPPIAVHLAWRDGFRHNSSAHMRDLSAHLDFLNGVVAEGVKQLSVIGTMHEIGYWEGMVSEGVTSNPVSLYGIAKDALRRALGVTLLESAELRWLRCYYITGDDRSNNSVFARLLEAVDQGASTFPFTSGKNKYDFIDVDELAMQIAVAATAEGLSGVINCGSGIPISLSEKVETFIKDNNLPIELQYGAFPERASESPAVWGDVTVITALTKAETSRKRGKM